MKTYFNNVSALCIHEIKNSRNARVCKLEVDIHKYQKALVSCEMTQAERGEFLNAMWSIIVAFIDLGYGIHPSQQTDGSTGHSVQIDQLADVLAKFAQIPART